MPYTEIQTKNAVPYYYRSLSLRDGKKFRKSRIYLGANLNKNELRQKEEEADLIFQSKKKKKTNPKIALAEIFQTKWNIRHNRASIAPPLTTEPLYDVFSVGFRPLFGDSYNQLLAVYSDGKMLVCWPETKMKKIGKIAFNQLLADPKILQKNRVIFEARFKTLIEFLRKSYSKSMSNTEVVKTYNKYFDLYKDACLYGEPFSFAVYEELAAHLEKILKKAVKNEKERLKMFTTLISPTEYSFINREEKELEEIIDWIKTQQNLKPIFKKNMYSLLADLKKNPAALTKIRMHQKKYFWISYDYYGSPLELDFFAKRIKERLESSRSEPEISLDQLRQKQQDIFRELLTKKMISPKDEELFIAAQEATLLLDYKKEKLSQAHYLINRILEKAAIKNNISPQDLLFARKDELPQALRHQLEKQILEDRRNQSVFYYSKNGKHVFSHNDAKKIIKYLESGKKGTIQELSGICASPGTLVGRIRLIKTASEINSIRKGEILVTGMTTPDYLVAMKKAAAIITDEGGMTCHAAIVSRELGIPCIVGTKNATTILHDGDIVELHAVNGVIKIIKSQPKSNKRKVTQ